MSSDSSDSSSSSEEKKKKKGKKYKTKDKKQNKKKKKKEKKNKDKKKKKDAYSQNAREKARLEAQQRLMGIDTNKKAKKKSKKKKSSSSSGDDSEEAVRKLQDRVEDATLIKEIEKAEAPEQAPAPEPEKPYDEMTWPERAAFAAQKAEADAVWSGASKADAIQAAEEAGEAVMRRAAQFGYVEPVKQRGKFNAATGKTKLSPVEEARLGGIASGVAATPGKGGRLNGKGLFGMAAPGSEGARLEGGGYMG